MSDKDRAFDIIKKGLSYSRSDMTEAVLDINRLSLTRFAESKIHQNIDKEETTLYIRLVKNKRMGIVTTGDISDKGIKKAVEDCEAILPYMPADENFYSFPKPDNVPLRENYISIGTANFSPEERAETVRLIASIAGKEGLGASGAFRIEEKSLAVANSLGIERFFMGNNAQLSITLSGESKNSGWALGYGNDVSQIDTAALAQRAAQKAVMSKNPIFIPDGQYTVILEPAAVGQLLFLLSFLGFSGKTLAQKRSFMMGKIDQKIAGDSFTVDEDPSEAAFGTPPFDYEGVTKVKVPLIEKGIAKGVVYNSYYAGLMGTVSTGSALPPNNGYGSYPKNMVVAAGDKNMEEIIKNTERGVLITHFWYLNYLNPMKTMVTGTTRDGTFLIEQGEIKSAVKNMRTNQSLLEAFSNIAAVSRESIVYPQYSILMKIPGMKINNFNLATEEEKNKC